MKACNNPQFSVTESAYTEMILSQPKKTPKILSKDNIKVKVNIAINDK